MKTWLENLHPLFAESRLWTWLAILAIAIMVTFAGKILLRALSHYLRRFVEKTESIWDDVAVDLLAGTKAIVIFAWAFHVLSKSMEPSESTHKLLLMAVVILTTVQVGIWGHHMIRNWRNTVLKKRIEEDPSSSAALGLLYNAVQTTFVIVVILAGLANLGVDIGALLAGLGVGGIAVALAAQNVLGDLLASLSIVLDKPFVVGDYIVAGNERGTVEYIGIRTTRVRSLSGEELVLSNKDILESRIQNFKHMWQRRVIHKFGVVYSTPAEKLEKIPEWVKAIVDRYDKLTYDRCHFAGYGGSSLDFEMVFFVTDPDYNSYMDHQQKVLLDIFKKFAAEGVEFAFPSQSLYVEKLPAPREPRA